MICWIVDMERTLCAKNDQDDEDSLDKLALEEIMKETKRGRERAETMGPIGWVKCPLQSTNKRFFRNVLMRAVSDSKRSTSRIRNVKETQSLASIKSTSSSNSDEFGSQILDTHLTLDSHEDVSETSTSCIPSEDGQLEKDSKRHIRRNKSLNVDPKRAQKDHKSSRKHKTRHKSKHKHKKRSRSDY